MEIWKEVRRRVLTKELSKRAACDTYGLGWETLKKILAKARSMPLAEQNWPYRSLGSRRMYMGSSAAAWSALRPAAR